MFPAKQCGCIEGGTQDAYQTSTQAKGGKLSKVSYAHKARYTNIINLWFCHIHMRDIVYMPTRALGMVSSKIGRCCL